MVNDIYDDYYLFVVKDVFYGENDEVCDGEGVDANDEDCKSCDGEGGDYEKLNYTQFSKENSTYNNDIIFKVGQYQEKSILNEDELSKFHYQCNEGKTENLVKYQDIWFIKEEVLTEMDGKKPLNHLIFTIGINIIFNHLSVLFTLNHRLSGKPNNSLNWPK